MQVRTLVNIRRSLKLHSRVMGGCGLTSWSDLIKKDKSQTLEEKWWPESNFLLNHMLSWLHPCIYSIYLSICINIGCPIMRFISVLNLKRVFPFSVFPFSFWWGWSLMKLMNKIYLRWWQMMTEQIDFTVNNCLRSDMKEVKIVLLYIIIYVYVVQIPISRTV